MKQLLVLIAVLWLSGCTVHTSTSKCACTGDLCSAPPASQQVAVVERPRPVVVRYTETRIVRRAPSRHVHSRNCRHAKHAEARTAKNVRANKKVLNEQFAWLYQGKRKEPEPAYQPPPVSQTQ